MIGVVDCNNFYVSCERISQPHLVGKPVVVLSNNDGCVVARSNEAKALGIPMGAPFFKVKHLVQQAGLIACSARLGVYTEISNQVMEIIANFSARMEQYSVDEAFVDFAGIPKMQEVAQDIVASVWHEAHIPVSIGIAPNKTLAKIASKFAKKYPAYKGCCTIDSDEKRIKALQLTEIGDVWGIGRKTQARLMAGGVQTALDFAQMEQARVESFLHTPGVQTWRELRGEFIFDLEQPTARQSMQHTRTFRQPICTLKELHGIIVDFAVKLSMKLRSEHSAAHLLTVFLATNRFDTHRPYEEKWTQHHFEVATCDERELATAARDCLQKIFYEGFPAKRAGVGVSLIEHGAVQGGLFDTVDREKQHRLQSAIDRIHAKTGGKALRLASQTDLSSVEKQDNAAPPSPPKADSSPQDPLQQWKRRPRFL